MFHACNEPAAKLFPGDILCLSANYFVIKRIILALVYISYCQQILLKKAKANNVLVRLVILSNFPTLPCGTQPQAHLFWRCKSLKTGNKYNFVFLKKAQ